MTFDPFPTPHPLDTDAPRIKAESDALIRTLSIPGLWDMAERFRPYVRDAAEPIDRPTPIEQRCRPLNGGLYPPCALCRKELSRCECDPTEAEEAMWEMFQAAKGRAA